MRQIPVILALFPFFLALGCVDYHGWEWESVPGMQCRDGSGTGLGVRRVPSSNDLVIYLQGGGSCFNAQSCGSNRDSYGQNQFLNWAQGDGADRGMFERNNPNNPVGGWNMVFVPYCTGDVHLGDATDVTVPGVAGTQQFVGHNNVAVALLAIANEAPGALDQLLLVGTSAGGFGAPPNTFQVAQAFPEADLTVVSDSGPLLDDDDVFAPCLQLLWRNLWGLDSHLAATCPACLGPDGDGMVNLYPTLSADFPGAAFGLISHTQDDVHRGNFSFGLNDCTGGPKISGEAFEAALLQTRDDFLVPEANGSSYLKPGDGHGMLLGGNFDGSEVGGVTLAEWLTDVVNGSGSHVGP